MSSCPPNNGAEKCPHSSCPPNDRLEQLPCRPHSPNPTQERESWVADSLDVFWKEFNTVDDCVLPKNQPVDCSEPVATCGGGPSACGCDFTQLAKFMAQIQAQQCKTQELMMQLAQGKCGQLMQGASFGSGGDPQQQQQQQQQMNKQQSPPTVQFQQGQSSEKSGPSGLDNIWRLRDIGEINEEGQGQGQTAVSYGNSNNNSGGGGSQQTSDTAKVDGASPQSTQQPATSQGEGPSMNEQSGPSGLDRPWGLRDIGETSEEGQGQAASYGGGSSRRNSQSPATRVEGGRQCSISGGNSQQRDGVKVEGPQATQPATSSQGPGQSQLNEQSGPSGLDNPWRLRDVGEVAEDGQGASFGGGSSRQQSQQPGQDSSSGRNSTGGGQQQLDTARVEGQGPSQGQRCRISGSAAPPETKQQFGTAPQSEGGQSEQPSGPSGLDTPWRLRDVGEIAEDGQATSYGGGGSSSSRRNSEPTAASSPRRQSRVEGQDSSPGRSSSGGGGKCDMVRGESPQQRQKSATSSSPFQGSEMKEQGTGPSGLDNPWRLRDIGEFSEGEDQGGASYGSSSPTTPGPRKSTQATQVEQPGPAQTFGQQQNQQPGPAQTFGQQQNQQPGPAQTFGPSQTFGQQQQPPRQSNPIQMNLGQNEYVGQMPSQNQYQGQGQGEIPGGCYVGGGFGGGGQSQAPTLPTAYAQFVTGPNVGGYPPTLQQQPQQSYGQNNMMGGGCTCCTACPGSQSQRPAESGPAPIVVQLQFQGYCQPKSGGARIEDQGQCDSYGGTGGQGQGQGQAANYGNNGGQGQGASFGSNGGDSGQQRSGSSGGPQFGTNTTQGQGGSEKSGPSGLDNAWRLRDVGEISEEGQGGASYGGGSSPQQRRQSSGQAEAQLDQSQNGGGGSTQKSESVRVEGQSGSGGDATQQPSTTTKQQQQPGAAPFQSQSAEQSGASGLDRPWGLRDIGEFDLSGGSVSGGGGYSSQGKAVGGNGPNNATEGGSSSNKAEESCLGRCQAAASSPQVNSPPDDDGASQNYENTPLGENGDENAKNGGRGGGPQGGSGSSQGGTQNLTPGGGGTQGLTQGGTANQPLGGESKPGQESSGSKMPSQCRCAQIKQQQQQQQQQQLQSQPGQNGSGGDPQQQTKQQSGTASGGQGQGQGQQSGPGPAGLDTAWKLRDVGETNEGDGGPVNYGGGGGGSPQQGQQQPGSVEGQPGQDAKGQKPDKIGDSGGQAKVKQASDDDGNWALRDVGEIEVGPSESEAAKFWV